nr:Transcription regulator, crp [uncultured bacterium]
MENVAQPFRQPAHFSPAGVNDKWPQISAVAPAQEYPAGIGLFKQDSLPQDVYLIDAGLIKLTHVEENGKELVVGLRTPNWIVGASAVILNKKYGYSAETLTGCQLRRVPAPAFLHLLRTDSEFAWQFQQVQSHELYDQLSQLVGFGCLSARHRLEQLLSQLLSTLGAKAGERKIRLQLPLKHWELAELIAVTPEHLSRLLKELQLEGVVQRDKGWINISDVSMLRSRLSHA